LAALDAQVLAVKVIRLTGVAAGQDFTPDSNELRRLRVTRRMVQKHAVAFEFRLVATSHQIDQQTSIGEAIKRGGHARSQARLVQSGAHGHQKLQALGDSQQARCHNPRVFA
jgi:hypothetical protein